LRKSGLAVGIKEAEEKAGREIAVLKATNEALHTRVLALSEHMAGSATGEYEARKTASHLVVQNRVCCKPQILSSCLAV
jgi:hypothetical protein